MVDIRLRQFLLQEIEQGQQHGAQGPEKFSERQITVLFLVHPLDHIEKIAGHEDSQHALEAPAIPENSRQFLDIDGLRAHHQVIEHPAFLSSEDIFLHAVGFQPQNLIQEFLLNALHIGRELVLEMPPVLFFGCHGIDKELMLGHPLDEHLHPGGNASHHVWIGAFNQKTDTHHGCSFQ